MTDPTPKKPETPQHTLGPVVPYAPEEKPLVFGDPADYIKNYVQPSTQRMSQNADENMEPEARCGHCLGQYPPLYMHGSVCRYCFMSGH